MLIYFAFFYFPVKSLTILFAGNTFEPVWVCRQ